MNVPGESMFDAWIQFPKEDLQILDGQYYIRPNACPIYAAWANANRDFIEAYKEDFPRLEELEFAATRVHKSNSHSLTGNFTNLMTKVAGVVSNAVRRMNNPTGDTAPKTEIDRFRDVLYLHSILVCNDQELFQEPIMVRILAQLRPGSENVPAELKTLFSSLTKSELEYILLKVWWPISGSSERRIIKIPAVLQECGQIIHDKLKLTTSEAISYCYSPLLSLHGNEIKWDSQEVAKLIMDGNVWFMDPLLDATGVRALGPTLFAGIDPTLLDSLPNNCLSYGLSTGVLTKTLLQRFDRAWDFTIGDRPVDNGVPRDFTEEEVKGKLFDWLNSKRPDVAGTVNALAMVMHVAEMDWAIEYIQMLLLAKEETYAKQVCQAFDVKDIICLVSTCEAKQTHKDALKLWFTILLERKSDAGLNNLALVKYNPQWVSRDDPYIFVLGLHPEDKLTSSLFEELLPIIEQNFTPVEIFVSTRSATPHQMHKLMPFRTPLMFKFLLDHYDEIVKKEGWAKALLDPRRNFDSDGKTPFHDPKCFIIALPFLIQQIQGDNAEKIKACLLAKDKLDKTPFDYLPQLQGEELNLFLQLVRYMPQEQRRKLTQSYLNLGFLLKVWSKEDMREVLGVDIDPEKVVGDSSKIEENFAAWLRNLPIETMSQEQFLDLCRFLCAFSYAPQEFDKVVEHLLARLKKMRPEQVATALMTKGRAGRALINHPKVFLAVEPLLKSIGGNIPVNMQAMLVMTRDHEGRTILHKNEGRSLLFLEEIYLFYGLDSVVQKLTANDNAGNVPLHFPDVLRAALPILKDLDRGERRRIFSLVNKSGVSVYDVAISARILTPELEQELLGPDFIPPVSPTTEPPVTPP